MEPRTFRSAVSISPRYNTQSESPTHNELRYVKSQIHIKKYINKALNTKQPMKNTIHKRTQW